LLLALEALEEAECQHVISQRQNRYAKLGTWVNRGRIERIR